MFAQTGWTNSYKSNSIESKQGILYFLSGDRGFIALANSKTSKYTNNGGLTWQDTTYPDIIFYPDFTMSRKYGFLPGNYALYQDSIGRTADSGISWIWKNTSELGIIFNVMDFISPQIGYLGGQFVWRTLDSAKTWTQLPFHFEEYNHINMLKFSDTLYGICVTEAFGSSGSSVWDTIWRTSDGGNTWLFCKQTFPGPIRFQKKYNRWIEVAYSGGINFSSTNGEFWENYPISKNDTTLAFIKSTFWDDSICYGITSLGHIYKSTDGGMNWLRQKTPEGFEKDVPSNKYNIDIVAVSPTIVYALYDTVLIKTIDGGAPLSVKLSPPCDCNTKISPEIASGAVTISFDAVPSAESIEIYDAIGRQVSSAQIPAEAASYRIDVSNYASGMYLAKLRGKMYRFVKVGN